MSHTLAAHLAAGNFYSALIADYTFIADSFIFTAIALPVFGRAEDTFAEKTITFRLKSTVVNGLRLGHFPVRPGANLLR
jgi:hypothetical protein